MEKETIKKLEELISIYKELVKSKDRLIASLETDLKYYKEIADMYKTDINERLERLK